MEYFVEVFWAEYWKSTKYEYEEIIIFIHANNFQFTIHIPSFNNINMY
jgi:hypothetical protein